MSRVITFSRVFPSYHPRKGEPTYFVEKIYEGIKVPMEYISNYKNQEFSYPFSVPLPKYHTIRAGHRWKVGDKFSPRVWSGKPYQSKMITIAPDIEIKKIFDFKMDLNGVYSVGGFYLEDHQYETLAQNDGLSEDDMFNWFMKNYNKPKEFQGQIICWNESVNY
jgi:hypothetical protein